MRDRTKRASFHRRRSGHIPLWVAVLLFCIGILLVSVWTYFQTSGTTPDGRELIVFWGSRDQIGDDVDTIIHRFEQKFPQYRIVMSSSVVRDPTGDAQRLMCAIAGGVPPDLVWFDRFAIGEWASRGAFTDLRPLLEAQKPDDPYRLDLSQYYDFAISEASYRPPGSNDTPGIFGVPASTDIRFMFCNADLLRQAGMVDEKGNPRIPQTWEDLRDVARKLTIYRNSADKNSGIVRLGFAPMTGNSSLFMYAWEAGGEMMNPARTKLTMDSPPIVRALNFVTGVYDDLGGVGQVKSFEEAQQGGSLDPFLMGRLAVKIDGNWFIPNIADWRPDMDFIVAPAPLPQDRLDSGAPHVAWSGGYAYVIPTSARHKQGALEFMKFIRSWESVALLNQGRREQRESEGRIHLPSIDVNSAFSKRIFDEAIFNNPKVPATFKNAYKVVLDLLPHTMIRPVTPVGQLLWTQVVRALDGATRHDDYYENLAKQRGEPAAKLVLADMQAPVQAALDRILQPPPPVEVNWKPYLWLYFVIMTAPFALIWIVYRLRRRVEDYKAREVGAAMLFISPWAFGFVTLVGGPILFSIVLSFTRYDVLSPARYVGLKNYSEVISDPIVYKSLWNTAYMVLALPLGMIASLSLALLLDRTIRGIGLYRAAFYMPVIMPLVAASLMWVWILNPSFGQINSALAWLYDTRIVHGLESAISVFTSRPFHFTLPLWLQDKDWSKPSLILMKLWGAGGGMIVWLAGLSSIPDQLYEAAKVDGANAWQRFRRITIPMLSPYILFNLIIGLIGTMRMWEESYIMTEGGPFDSTLFYAYYLFKQAFQFFQMGYASALAWLLFVAVIILTIGLLHFSKKWVYYEQS